LIIGDAKRGDIGSTAEAYADAFFRPVDGRPFCDAVTVNPYLGPDSWLPFCERATQCGGGIFVLVKTSNPGSAELQDLSIGTQTLYERVADQVEQANRNRLGTSGYGPMGAVVGATHPRHLVELRGLMPSAWILVPGFGAQGGSAKDTAGAFDERGLGAVVNSSRAIIFAYRDAKYATSVAAGNWQAAVEHATCDAIAQLRAETNAGRLN
jgi:orotidine-5'-phosphate decarboxylase